VANHLGLDLDLVELLAGVDADDGADHLRDDDHVTEVGLDEVGLLVGPGLLLGLAELLDQTHGLALETAVEPSARAGVDEVAELLRAEVEELVEVDTAVGELAERALGLEGCGARICQPLFIFLHAECVCCVCGASLSIACCLRPPLSRTQGGKWWSWRNVVAGFAGGGRSGSRDESVPAASSAFCAHVSNCIQ
jgi:hypothetical protein